MMRSLASEVAARMPLDAAGPSAGDPHRPRTAVVAPFSVLRHTGVMADFAREIAAQMPDREAWDALVLAALDVEGSSAHAAVARRASPAPPA